MVSKNWQFCILFLHCLLSVGEFGSLKWSPSETQLIYIAEKKIAKSEPFYKRNAKKDKDDVVKVY